MGKLEEIIERLKKLESDNISCENIQLEQQRLLNVMDQIIESIIEDLSHNINFQLWKKHYNEYSKMDLNIELKAELKKALIKAHVICRNIIEEKEYETLNSTLKEEKNLSKVIK